MKIPKIFEDDIQSDDIQLIPLLIIEKESATSNLDDNSVFLSTHDINIRKTDGVPYADGEFDDGMYFSPLLLDNPVINEKIDVENRKYTISKCTFKISNNPYEGTRFSDILNTDNLIGRKVNFAYKSINSSFPVGSMYLADQGITSWTDLYDDYGSISPTFYYGEIIDIKHDNETLTITAEDLSSTRLHQDLPKNSLPANQSVEEHYRNASIPMVYGYMPKSPVVMGANKKVYADSRPIEGWFKNNINKPGRRYGYPFDNQDYSPLFISVDDHLCCISEIINYRLEETDAGWEPDSIQLEYAEDDIYDTSIIKFASTFLSQARIAQLMVVYKPSKITLQERNYNTTWDAAAVQVSLGDSTGDWGEDGDLLLENEFSNITDGDFSSGHAIASSDVTEPSSSKAMVNTETADSPFADYALQLQYNRWKHSLFRFIIDTEPPITFITRGGLSTNGNTGTYWHWISFGHWVMPEQSINSWDASHHIYTNAKQSTSDQSYQRIRERFYSASSPVKDYQQRRPYESDTNDIMVDSFGNGIQFGDIVRFSDFHENADWESLNPEQINWETYETGGKSPLEFFGITTFNTSTNDAYNKTYTNPYAKFTNIAQNGQYIVELGAYGWQTSYTNTGSSTNNFKQPPGDVAPFFRYEGKMKGWLPETTCMSVCDTKINFQDMYGSILGRIDASDNLITHPADIIADIFVNELGHSESKIDQDSLVEAKSWFAHLDWEFSFTQKDSINSKELIEDIARSTFMFPRIGFDGVLRFPQIKGQYVTEEFDAAIMIEDLDIISYSYNLTKRSDLITSTHMQYDYDHQNDNYFGDKETKSPSGELYIDNQITVTDASYHGIEDASQHIKEFESKYMRTSDYTDSDIGSNNFVKSIRKFQERNTHYYRNRHLIIKCKLPIKYLNIDVGDNIKFNKLIDDVKAYGIDYTKLENINDQWIFPLFICTSIKKSIEYVELECIQLHHLYYAHNNLTLPDYLPNLDNSFSTPIPKIYYDDISAYGVEEELDTEDDTDVPPVQAEPIISIPNNAQALYTYSTFDLIEGETEYPYETYSGGEYLYMMQTQEGYNFSDPDTGIYKLFSVENFIAWYGSDEGYLPITDWNDLLPGEFTTTTNSNMDYILLEVHHVNTNFGFDYTYKLKNTQTIIGQPIQIGWELYVNQSDGNYDNGMIFAAPFTDIIFPGSTFSILNRTNHSIQYHSPHPLTEPEMTLGVPEIGFGDLNADGTANILDILVLINMIIGTTPIEGNVDMNQDNTLNILDLVVLLNYILGND